MDGPEADEDLVELVRAGDTALYAVLCDRHRQRVWRIVSTVTRGADAEDLAQDALVRAYRALPGYRRSAPFGAWLCRIALNVAHDYLRSAWRRRVTLFGKAPPETSGAISTTESDAELRELQRRVRHEVARLPEAQRTAVWLHYFESYPVAEIARLVDLPDATVRSRLRAGLRRLSLSLDDLLAEAYESPVRRESEARICEG